MQRKVFSIIVTYNPDLIQFKGVLLAHFCTGATQVLIVDNGSANRAELDKMLNQYLSRNLLQICYLENNKGLGYAQNVGINLAKAADCHYVMLFDQDSIVPETIISELVREEEQLIAEGVKVGAIGPGYFDGRTENYYPQIKVKGLQIEKIYANQHDSDHLNVSFIIASGSLIRIATLNDVGLMNEDLFIDCIDIEWCFRASAKGYEMFVSQTVTISHTIGDTRLKSLGREISMHSPVRRYYMMRNNLLISRFSWIPTGYRARLIIFTFLKVPVYVYDVRFNLKHIKYMFKGLYDGILNRSGAGKF